MLWPIIRTVSLRTILMRGRNICLRWEIRKIIFELSSIPPFYLELCFPELHLYLANLQHCHLLWLSIEIYKTWIKVTDTGYFLCKSIRLDQIVHLPSLPQLIPTCLEWSYKYGLINHCILMDSFIVICWMSPFVIWEVWGLFRCFYSFFLWKILFANKVDPDQKPHYVASDLVFIVCLWPFYGFPGKNGLMPCSELRLYTRYYLAWIKAPFPTVWISDGGSIVENNTSGTYFLLQKIKQYIGIAMF